MFPLCVHVHRSYFPVPCMCLSLDEKPKQNETSSKRKRLAPERHSEPSNELFSASSRDQYVPDNMIWKSRYVPIKGFVNLHLFRQGLSKHHNALTRSFLFYPMLSRCRSTCITQAIQTRSTHWDPSGGLVFSSINCTHLERQTATTLFMQTFYAIKPQRQVG